MTPHARLRAFGAAGLLTVAGVLCGAFVNGLTGQLLTIVLISFGLGGWCCSCSSRSVSARITSGRAIRTGSVSG
ncbi:MAG: hypothetical protein ACLP0J_03360 [Solirubrobacteraceae bacterium]